MGTNISATESLDLFNHSIDFGDRRERLRLNFEWELDRTFLAEEFQKRRHEKEAADAAERRRVEAIAKAARAHSPEKTTKSFKEEEGLVDVTAAQRADAETSTSETILASQFKQLDWHAFRPTHPLPHDGSCCIDVLIGEPAIANTQDPWYGYSSGSFRKAPEAANQLVQDLPEPGKRPVPERIRICSPLLQSILSKVLGNSVNAGTNSDFVLLRPFKALMYREEALRDWFSALERKFGSPKKGMGATDVELGRSESEKGEINHISTVANPATRQAAVQDAATEPHTTSSDDGYGGAQDTKKQARGDNNDHDEEGTQSEGAMEHLRTLLHFIDSEIVPRRSYLESSSCKKVHFSDLWYLFRPGIEVIGNDGKQVYRVVKVSSARHRVVPTWEMYWAGGKEKDKKKAQPPFSIKCVFVDFDGKSLGPVTIDFDFPRFIGAREVTTFQVYPLRFHPHRRSDFSHSEWRAVSSLPEDQRLRAKLVLRGKKFLEVANVRQMY